MRGENLKSCLFNQIKIIFQLGFTLSQATNALRESGGIALLYFRPRHQKSVKGQRHAPAAPYPRERSVTHCTGGWVGLRAGLDWCGKSRPTGIRSLDRPARRQSLYRLHYPAHSSYSNTRKENNRLFAPEPIFLFSVTTLTTTLLTQLCYSTASLSHPLSLFLLPDFPCKLSVSNPSYQSPTVS